MVKISMSPPRFEENAIFDPSADQVGCPSNAGLVVSWVIPEPSASMSQMSNWPVRSLANAMRDPSGEKAGSTLSATKVSCWTSDPSPFIVKTWSPPPERSLSKAIRPLGCVEPVTRVEALATAAGGTCAPGPESIHAPAGPARRATAATAPRALQGAQTRTETGCRSSAGWSMMGRWEVGPRARRNLARDPGNLDPKGDRMTEITAYQHGQPSWADLSTPDPDGGRAFYSALFGWEANDVPAGEGVVYTMFT